MDWGIVARAIHILAVVVWIGGVSFVTTVVLPGMRNKPATDWVQEFDAVERRFAPQARISLMLVLLSGLYMLWAYDLWGMFTRARFWWMHLMVGVWAIFAALLFVVEPLAIGNSVRQRAIGSPEAVLARLLWMHRVLLVLSLFAVFAAVCGSLGLF